MNLQGTRKFGLTLLVVGLSFILVVLGKLDGPSWVAVATMVLGIFGAANVVDKMKGGHG